jgi:uncharacterized protein YbjQ (UPF0145 family)
MFVEVRTWLSAWYNMYAVMVLSAVTGLFGYEWIAWSKLSASDWGTWVGSIGTVAAFVGTIWLATTEKREARKQAIDRAVVAAAALGPRLQRIGDALNTVVDHLFDHTHQKKPIDYRTFADLIENAGTWTDEEILPLIILRHHVCTRLAGVRPIKQNVVREMRYLADNWTRSWVNDTLDKRQGAIAGDVVISRDIVRFATEACKSVVKQAVQP